MKPKSVELDTWNASRGWSSMETVKWKEGEYWREKLPDDCPEPVNG
jgi:hypothetical protein